MVESKSLGEIEFIKDGIVMPKTYPTEFMLIQFLKPAYSQKKYE